MNMTYKVLIHTEQYREIYRLMDEQDLLWAAWPEVEPEEWSAELMVNMFTRRDFLVLGGYVDGQLAGAMTLYPDNYRSRVAWIGLTAFRPYFPQAEELCRGALLWALDTQDISAIMGKVAAPNRHIIRMLGLLGFREVVRVPDLMWFARFQKWVAGVLVMATPESIRETAPMAQGGNLQ